jgi:hypothetical protein
LRLKIALQINPRPTAPVLCAETPTPLVALENPSYVASLPWFAVRDPHYSRIEQLNHSPFYLLERTDQYLLVGHANNTDNHSQIFRWSAPRAQRAGSLQAFTHTTSVEFGAQWQTNLHDPLLFSARLGHDFTQCEIHSNEWLNAAVIDVVAVVDKNRSVAAYLMQSDYRLLRADGTSVTDAFSYTDGNSLHISQYAPIEPETVVVPAPEPVVEPSAQTSVADDEISAALAETELPVATDTAP